MTARFVNDYHLPIPDLSDTGEAKRSLLAVLVSLPHGGPAGPLHRAYEAIVTLPDVSDRGYAAARQEAAQRVMDRGTRCSRAREQALFPGVPAKGWD